MIHFVFTPTCWWTNSLLCWFTLYAYLPSLKPITATVLKEEVKIFIRKPSIFHRNLMCIQGRAPSGYKRCRFPVNLQHMMGRTQPPPPSLLHFNAYDSFRANYKANNTDTAAQQYSRVLLEVAAFHVCYLSWATQARCLPNALPSICKVACKYN